MDPSIRSVLGKSKRIGQLEGWRWSAILVADVFVADVRWQQKSLQVPPHWRPFFPPFVRAPTVLRPPLEMWLAWVQPSKVRGYQSGGAGVPRTLS